MSNLIYLLMAAAASVACENHLIFLAATSFVHSLRIMATCYFRSKSSSCMIRSLPSRFVPTTAVVAGHVDFGVFKRDVVLFKSVAFAQILYYYGHSIKLVQPESAGLVGVGCLITAAAAIALGTDRLCVAYIDGLQYILALHPHPQHVRLPPRPPSKHVSSVGFTVKNLNCANVDTPRVTSSRMLCCLVKSLYSLAATRLLLSTLGFHTW